MEYIGDIIYDEKILDTDIRFIIYGAGKVGQRIYEYFRINDREGSIKYFCDANSSLWGQKVKGVAVESPDKLIEEYGEYHFIFAGQYADEICRLLIKRDIKNIHYVWIS